MGIRRMNEPQWSVVLIDRAAERHHFALGLGALAAAGYLALAVVGFLLGWAARFLLVNDHGLAAPWWIPIVAALALPGLLLLPLPWFLAHPDVDLDVEAPDAADFRRLVPYGRHAASGAVILNALFVMPHTLAEALRVLRPGGGWGPERVEAGAGLLAQLHRADGWVPLDRFAREIEANADDPVLSRVVFPALLALDLVWTRAAPMTRHSPGGQPEVRLDPQLIP